MIEISVIVPAYNAEARIGECLKALNNQTLSRDSYEIIVVNDGSTDNTGGIAKDAGVIVIDQTNQGPAIARNEGVKRAGGDIVVFTDSDCIADPDFLAEMTRPFSDSSVMGVKGAYRTHQTRIWARFAQVEFMERYAKLSRSDSIDFVDSYAAAFKRLVFCQVGGFDAHFPVANNEDVDLSYKIARLGHKMVFNPDAIVYHTHPDSLKVYLKLKFSRAYWRMLVYRKFPEKIVSDSYTPQSLKLQIMGAGLLIAGLIGGIVSKPLLLATPWFLLFYLAATVPFLFRAAHYDIGLLWFCPIAVFLRSLAFGTGILFGMIAQRRRNRLFPLLLLFSDSVAAIGAYFLAFWSRSSLLAWLMRPFDHTLGLYLSLFPVVLSILLLSCQSFGLYREKSHHSRVKEFTSATRAVSHSVLAIVIISFFLKWDYSRFFIIFYWILAIILINVLRTFVRRIQDRLRRKGLQSTLSIIVGTGTTARQLLTRLKESGDAGQKIVGVVDDEKPGDDDSDWSSIPWMGPVSDLDAAILTSGADDVFIAKSDWPHQKVLDLVVRCEKTGAGFKIISDLATIVTGGAMLSSVSGIPVIDLKEERQDWGRKAVKQFMDFLIGGILLMLLLPLMILTGILVHVLIPGSILVEQERVGRNGRLFKMLRFRVAPNPKGRLLDQSPSGFGRFLQRTHLDELPQFLNVLRGEMSLVGPRPEVPEIVSTYEPWQRKRLDVAPGMTGLWQILGPGDEPLHKNLEYDFYYIKNYCIWMDLSILVQTIPVIFAGKGKVSDP
ncbi:exopolysaccharide biosynthesis polyprenyl glycosylphosphotransferase [bacterium]|nr:exopolysaccharide biosynthesis polyprenyl glycosylphosphotransferase [candidate division CSSED10-310 bacterium]